MPGYSGTVPGYGGMNPVYGGLNPGYSPAHHPSNTVFRNYNNANDPTNQVSRPYSPGVKTMELVLLLHIISSFAVGAASQ